jgi:hypothetical protein
VQEQAELVGRGRVAGVAVGGEVVLPRLDVVLGLASNPALRRHVAALEKTTAQRFRVASKRGKVRRFAQFYDAAHSWSRVERIIARVEAGPEGADTRFIVTNLEAGRAKHL